MFIPRLFGHRQLMLGLLGVYAVQIVNEITC